MNPTIRRASALASALAITASVTACSRSESPATPDGQTVATSSTGTTPAPTTDTQPPKPAEIFDRAKSNALAATSAVVTGEFDRDGATTKISWQGAADGKTLDLRLTQHGLGNVHLIAVGGDVYLQADATGWKALGFAKLVQAAGDKFVKAPAASVGDLAQSFSLRSLVEKSFGSLDASGLNGRVGSETVDGIDCWVLTGPSGAQNGALYVAKDSMQLVRIVGPKEKPLQLTFSQWGQDLDIKAPPPDEVVGLK